MLPEFASFERLALNRVTFGARDLDVAYAAKIGWSAWVQEQLRAPPGDDPGLAAHLQSQRWPIKYAAGSRERDTWAAVDEDRPLTYLTASAETLWKTVDEAGFSISPDERNRIYPEFLAGYLIRNTHAKWQLREFMADFWYQHFNIGIDKNVFSANLLIAHDRDVIRPNVFGNFRKFLEGVATSTAMLIYLDNYISTAGKPNENYARELLELHTMGGGAYLGQSDPFAGNPASRPEQSGVNAPGFTDADIIEASRAFSGWTIERGQMIGGVRHKVTAAFLYNPAQHNTSAKNFMGVDLSSLTADLAQGRAILDIVANHPSTATFICTKLCRRIFGDNPPASVIARATTAWMANRQAPDQIGIVLDAILTGGNEIGVASPIKIRRPYERLVALLRTTDMTANACSYLYLLFSSVGDVPGAWQAPNGRPDINSYWLSTAALMKAINIVMGVTNVPEIKINLTDQMPIEATQSTVKAVDYWLERMIGMQLDSATYDGLIKSAQDIGVWSLEKGYRAGYEDRVRQLVALIATTTAFTYR